MKKFIGITFIFVLFFGSATQIKAEWLKDQQGKWTYYENISNQLVYENKNLVVQPTELPQYYQADARWGDKRYGISNMKITGCVPTSLAMVISGLVKDVTPVQVADYIYDTSMEMNMTFSGTSSFGAEIALEYWDLNYRTINSKEDLETALKKGDVVYGAVGHGIFVRGYSTHAVVLSGYQNGKVHAVDPDNPERTNKWYSIDDIWNQRSVAPEDNVTGGAFIVVSK